MPAVLLLSLHESRNLSIRETEKDLLIFRGELFTVYRLIIVLLCTQRKLDPLFAYTVTLPPPIPPILHTRFYQLTWKNFSFTSVQDVELLHQLFSD